MCHVVALWRWHAGFAALSFARRAVTPHAAMLFALLVALRRRHAAMRHADALSQCLLVTPHAVMLIPRCGHSVSPPLRPACLAGGCNVATCQGGMTVWR